MDIVKDRPDGPWRGLGRKRAATLGAAELEAIAAVGKIALNLRFMESLPAKTNQGGEKCESPS